MPELYQEFKQHQDGGIPAPTDVDSCAPFSAEQREILDEVDNVYSQFSAWALRNMTHEEAPWKDADAQGANVEITHDALRAFFQTRLER